MITIELEGGARPTVTLTRSADASAGAWSRLQEAFSRGMLEGSKMTSVVKADVFFAEMPALKEAKNRYGETYVLGSNIRSHMVRMSQDSKVLQAMESMPAPTPETLESLKIELREAGFIRDLKDFQVMNVAKLDVLPHGADFSVPGAGKTTVALAGYALRRHRGLISRSLVVGPLAAFGAWQEDSALCFDKPPRISVYGGNDTRVASDTDILLVNYQRAANDYDTMREFVGACDSQMVLDEAHRIKKGMDGTHGKAVLDMAYVAKRRDVLTGTPAPQGAFDLIALIKFLYPGQDKRILPSRTYNESKGRDSAVLLETQQAISKFFVRTKKSELKLPPTKFNVVYQDMGPIQAEIYKALVGKYVNGFAFGDRSRQEMRRRGRIIMYLLEAATNPALLNAGSDPDDEIVFEHEPLEVRGNEHILDLLRYYTAYERPWKYDYVMAAARQAAASGQKIIVWSNFVRNLKILKVMLAEFNPAVVHGGVPSSANGPTTAISREEEIRRFREDDNCSVFLGNPAACGEGVSLHHWCHEAIYLDRTFNAGHFLQSMDRIHRLGLDDDILTKFTLLISRGSADQAVNGRLEEKVKALAILMDDPGLVAIALPSPEDYEGSEPVFEDDIGAVEAHINMAWKNAA